MLTYALRRLLWIVPILFAASVITFLLMHGAPGSPWNREHRPLSPEMIAVLNARYGMDQPLPVQYAKWLWNVLHGDFGTSFNAQTLEQLMNPFVIHHDTVADRVGAAALPSLQLALLAFGFALIVGVSLGVLAAWNHDGWIDHVATGIGLLGMIGPPFLLAVVLQLVFRTDTGHDGILPVEGWETPRHWILPTLALAGLPMAMIVRFTRSSVLEVLGEGYVRTAHSKGLSPQRVALVHVLRNALIPVMAVLGPVLAVLITGSIVIEIVFGIPGVGSLYFLSITQRDYGVIMSMTLIYTVAIAGLNLIVDLLYGVVDPRIRSAA